MAIAAIYVLLVLAGFLVWLGMHREDVWIIMFSGIMFLFSGLTILINGFEDLEPVYAQAVGVLILFLGIYFIIRGIVEFVQENM